MFAALREWWQQNRAAWRGLKAFESVPRAARRIVFYAETAADWAFLGDVVEALARRGERILRVTSDLSDPVLARDDAFFVGFGSARTVFFRTVDADVFVMTLSDLDRFHLKRSAHSVHYVYVFHSIASTHRVYREHAFDAYDTILCVGPHHIAELRKTEAVYGLAPKRLLEHGYGRLDTLMRDLRYAAAAPTGAIPDVLVAPSWGESSLVAHGLLDRVIAVLLDAGFRVTLRLHPMTRRHEPSLAGALLERFSPTGRFRFDPHINTTESLLAADIMISEWSGAPLEYAFARERPVIFIDTPPKTHNAAHERIGLPYLEQTIREELGRVIAPADLDTLPGAVRSLLAEAPAWAGRIRAARERTVFHVGGAGEVAAEHILAILAGRSIDG